MKVKKNVYEKMDQNYIKEWTKRQSQDSDFWSWIWLYNLGQAT